MATNLNFCFHALFFVSLVSAIQIWIFHWTFMVDSDCIPKPFVHILLTLYYGTNNKKHAMNQHEWAEPTKKLSWICVMKHISRVQEWLGEHGRSIPTKQNYFSLVWAHHTSNKGVYITQHCIRHPTTGTFLAMAYPLSSGVIICWSL
jgi:hypothetical protein